VRTVAAHCVIQVFVEPAEGETFDSFVIDDVVATDTLATLRSKIHAAVPHILVAEQYLVDDEGEDLSTDMELKTLEDCGLTDAPSLVLGSRFLTGAPCPIIVDVNGEGLHFLVVAMDTVYDQCDIERNTILSLSCSLLIALTDVPSPIYIKDSTHSKELIILVVKTDTVHSVKLKIEASEGIPVSEQFLYFKQRFLADNELLTARQIKQHDTLAIKRCFLNIKSRCFIDRLKVADRVLSLFKTKGEKSDWGCTIQEVCAELAAQNIPERRVRRAVEFLSNEAHLYSTIDDEHFKATA
jgi:hypothetical protein